MQLKVVPRSVWGSAPPAWEKDLDIPVKYVFTIYTYKKHCFNLESCAKELRYLQQIHMRTTNPGPDIKYNFMVANNGSVFEGRGWTNRPTLPKMNGRINHQSLYIAFLGNFAEQPPPDRMYEARNELLKFGLENYLIAKQYLEIFYNVHINSISPFLNYRKKNLGKTWYV